MTSSLAVASSSVKTAGRATMMAHATQSQLRPQVKCHRSVDHFINALAEKAICENLLREFLPLLKGFCGGRRGVSQREVGWSLHAPLAGVD